MVLSAVFALGLIGTVKAYDIGGAVTRTATKTGKGVARGAVANEYNKKLAKEKCKFVGDSTTQYTGCDLDKIITEMNALRNAAEASGFANDVDVEVKTYGADWNIARERANFLRDKIRTQVGYWDYNVRYTKAPSNEVYFQIKIR